MPDEVFEGEVEPVLVANQSEPVLQGTGWSLTSEVYVLPYLSIHTILANINNSISEANIITLINIYLLQGQDINNAGLHHATALHLSAYYNLYNVSQHLIENRALVNVFDQGACTPLHIACARGNLAVARLLIENNADVDLRDVREYSPLHMAAEAGHLNIVWLLAENNAGFLYINSEGQTAEEIAARNDLRNIYLFLHNYETLKNTQQYLAIEDTSYSEDAVVELVGVLDELYPDSAAAA